MALPVKTMYDPAHCGTVSGLWWSSLDFIEKDPAGRAVDVVPAPVLLRLLLLGRLLMGIAVPRDRCYYYECSHGRVRLTHFIPPNEMKKKVEQRKMSRDALDDFPDGVDLDCTEPDFADFHAQYGYRPKHDADDLVNAFYALFSSTRGWKTYCGTGLIEARELESRLEEMEQTLREVVPKPEPEPPPPPPPTTDAAAPARPPVTFRELSRRRIASVRASARIERALRTLRVRDVDGRRPIDKQKFRKVRMGEGRAAHEVFSALLRRQRGEDAAPETPKRRTAGKGKQPRKKKGR